MLADLSEVRGQLDRGCQLLKSDGGFRMIDWMVSLGALYRNCLANVRKVEQNGNNLFFLAIPAAYSNFTVSLMIITCETNYFTAG